MEIEFTNTYDGFYNFSLVAEEYPTVIEVENELNERGYKFMQSDFPFHNSFQNNWVVDGTCYKEEEEDYGS